MKPRFEVRKTIVILRTDDIEWARQTAREEARRKNAAVEIYDNLTGQTIYTTEKQ